MAHDQTLSDIQRQLARLQLSALGALKKMEDKRDQLIKYKAGIDGDGSLADHARAVAEGRIQQVDLDILAFKTSFTVEQSGDAK